MASTLSLKVGAAAVVTLTFQNDAQVVTVLRAFDEAVLATPGETGVTDRDKIFRTLRWFVKQLRDRGMERHAQTERQRVDAESEALFNLVEG